MTISEYKTIISALIWIEGESAAVDASYRIAEPHTKVVNNEFISVIIYSIGIVPRNK
jgi:hypothetical protein